MKILFTLLFAAMAFMPGKPEVTFDYDKKVNFGEFKTFAIGLPSDAIMKAASATNPTLVNASNEIILEGNIIYLMEGKGYKQSSTPDLMVTYNIRLNEGTEYQSTTVDVGPPLWGPYYYGGFYGYDAWPGMSLTTVTSENFQTGSVVIDVVSTKTNTLVWYGAAANVIPGNTTEASEQIPSKIEQIFDYYYWTAGQSAPVKKIPGSKK